MSAILESLDDELVNAETGPAVRDAIQMRIEQIVKHGHTREEDAMQPIDHLPREAAKRLQAAMDQVRGVGELRNLPVARKNLVRAAAMCLAAVDRLDAAMAPKEERP